MARSKDGLQAHNVALKKYHIDISHHVVCGRDRLICSSGVATLEEIRSGCRATRLSILARSSPDVPPVTSMTLSLRSDVFSMRNKMRQYSMLRGGYEMKRARQAGTMEAVSTNSNEGSNSSHHRSFNHRFGAALVVVKCGVV